MAAPGRTLKLHSCDCRFDVHCATDPIAALIEDVFGALAAPPDIAAAPHREYFVDGTPRNTYRVSSAGSAQEFADADGLLFHLDKLIAIDLQHLRADLFFVHGAAIARRGRAAVLSAPPGTGKSKLALAALQHGFDYFSDELAPIDLSRLTVCAYPRAPHLKTPERRYVPVMTMGSAAVAPRTAWLGALVFLRRDGERFDGLRRLTAASAAAHLMANTLNLLAHASAGLDGAAAICQAVSCFELDVTDLAAASEALRGQLDRDDG
jgi:hypothetical protein